MQLSLLQSRLAASVIASCLLIVLYLFLFAPQLAFAADLSQIPSRVGPVYDVEDTTESLDLRGPLYEPEFSLFDRSIMGRVTNGAFSLDDDKPTTSNIDPGNTNVYVFEVATVSGRSAQEPSTSHELREAWNGTQAAGKGEGDDELASDVEVARRQQSSKTIYISANTCNQPERISPDQTTMDPPQLTLFVSTSSENTSPGPGKSEDTQKAIVFDEGAVMFNTSLNHAVYFSISAPQVSDTYFTSTLPYNYEIAVSLNGYYHAYDNEAQPNLYWVDSDASATLLTTRNLTDSPEEVVSTPPYTVFVQNTNNVGVNGIRNSYCGLSAWAQIRPLQDGSSQATIGLRQGGEANLTMQEFYISGLNASTSYTGILARNASSALQKRQNGGTGGGMIVYKGVDFSTKPNGACTFIFNLTLCTETQYAVPGNSTIFPNATALAHFYDNYTQTMWDNFDKVLQQTACQAPPTQKYSLAKDCDDCKTAYKNWLCSVAIPRCEDFSSPNQSYLQMRNINAPFPNGSFVDQSIRQNFSQVKAYNSSRNLDIDETVQPGPYKEVLPCDYLCYELVKSCPASMGFSCPLRNSKYGFNTSYAIPNSNESLSCNYPGSAYYPGAAGATAVSWVSMMIFITVALVFAL
ncbi:stretch-activated Ca2+-permeable channel component-domain-containing protein [Xylariaceae sp. FL1651]|nr:stretch-activated Ca2+-permeable channel component-domain-containing protein [Xylariaceae sp. FL1651]